MVENNHGSHARVGDLVQHLQPYDGAPIDKLIGVVYKIEQRAFEKFVYTTAVNHSVRLSHIMILERA